MTENAIESISPEEIAVEKLRADAFSVLTESVDGLVAEGSRNPTASEVRLEMKRRTYGGFEPKLIGFRRFREFLNAAAEAGHVVVDASSPGDPSVSRPTTTRETADPAYPVRGDLWRAFVDWDPRKLRYYDKVADRAVMIPAQPVLFEPTKFQEIRSRLQQEA